MKEMNGITVILPVYEVNQEIEQYFALAIASINNQAILPDELLIVTSSNEELKTFVNGFDYGTIKENVRIIENTGNTDFPSQFNFGVENAKTEWVSFLEVDDEFSRIWIKNVITYREAYPEINTFLPIIVDVDAEGQFIGLTNEPVWAAEFCDELGILDHQALIGYQNFNFAGMVIRKSVIEEFYGMKSNLKLTFMYEFLLRLTHFDTKIMVIPKIGYKHTNQRVNSLFYNYKQEMKPNEGKWWLAQAKKEFYFTHDNRGLTYTEPAEKEV
jgi:GT2 family glycosyltransferase